MSSNFKVLIATVIISHMEVVTLIRAFEAMAQAISSVHVHDQIRLVKLVDLYDFLVHSRKNSVSIFKADRSIPMRKTSLLQECRFPHTFTK
jgi:hypothetical protein